MKAIPSQATASAGAKPPTTSACPVLRTLFHQLADPQQLRHLGLEEVLDWTEATLARVERAAFFQRFPLGEAVQYFFVPVLDRCGDGAVGQDIERACPGAEHISPRKPRPREHPFTRKENARRTAQSSG
jgi:hypothetical protein